ncbi:hypothetical protein E2C01_048304 [Portunus trituberculatus]|uniref:RNA-directed DNA polymerase from mobile element jockey n=1 Tax=Portunus trituberculatus TaxID=210409 RepID=A0A5B7G2T1_PORTR|nr:hypothetical protein [Portunus trituberculatus]
MSGCLSRNLGVTIDRELRYDTHITSVARQTSQHVLALCRVAGCVDPRGILTLYKAQIRSCMEYGALTWMSSPSTYTRRRDAVQRRALRVLGKDEEIAASITSLEHRRDIATLTMCHKAWVQHTPHLTRLSLPPHPPGRQAGGGASLPLLTTPAIFQSQGSASVEPLHGGHA